MYRRVGLIGGGGVRVGGVRGSSRGQTGGRAEREVSSVGAGLSGQVWRVGLTGAVSGRIHSSRLIVGVRHVRAEVCLRRIVGAAEELLVLLGLSVELGDRLLCLEELRDVRIHIRYVRRGYWEQRLLFDSMLSVILLE